MYSALTLVFWSAALMPAQSHPEARFAGYNRHEVLPIPPICLPGPCPPACPPGGPCPPLGFCPPGVPSIPCFPIFGGMLVGEDSDRLDKIDKALHGVDRLLKELDRRFGKMKKKMDESESQVNSRLDAGENAMKKVADSQDELYEMVEIFESKLSERLKNLAKSIDLRITEEKLNTGLDAIKDREKLQESFHRELRRIEDKLAALQTQRATDADARKALHDIDQALKTRIDRLSVHTEAPTKASKSSDHNGYQVPNNRALIMVNVPADARLFLEGKLTEGNGHVRAFVTPELEMGATYSYTLVVEIPRQGRTESSTRQVYFRAGSQVRVDLNPTQAMPAAH